MPFVKGQSGNPLGRPKRSVNQITKSMKESFAHLIADNMKDFQKDLNKMPEAKKWDILLRMSDKLLPNLKSVEAKVQNSIEKPAWIENLKQLNDNQIDLILNANDEDE